MKNIAVMDTSIMSFNLGDQIIMESARKGLSPILKNAFVINMPTHSPLFHRYEFSLRGTNSFSQSLDMVDLKFVCGTNLFEKDMFKRKNTWNINILDAKYINDFIFVGVGTDGLPQITNGYTEKLYRKILSSKFFHSVRDEKTKSVLEDLGFKAIMTGCVTLWPLTKIHCIQIPRKKSDTVISTITDYMPDKKNDEELLRILSMQYKEIYFWPQGIMDMTYFESLDKSSFSKSIKIISPSLQAYNEFLDSMDCDYVGTRLHAGIKAMQKGKRSIIVGVDNRAKDMNESFNLNYVDRNDLGQVEKMIRDEFSTEIIIDERQIEQFLAQFES